MELHCALSRWVGGVGDASETPREENQRLGASVPSALIWMCNVTVNMLPEFAETISVRFCARSRTNVSFPPSLVISLGGGSSAVMCAKFFSPIR